MRIPIQAPRANSIAERWVRTARRECLDHLIPISERHLRTVLAEFVDYYNHDRLHRSLGLQAPFPKPSATHGRIAGRPVLGRLHHVYERAA
jgi:transposase InsO family protein